MAAPLTKGQVRRNIISNAGRVKSFVDDSSRERAIVSTRVISVSRSTETRLVLRFVTWRRDGCVCYLDGCHCVDCLCLRSRPPSTKNSPLSIAARSSQPLTEAAFVSPARLILLVQLHYCWGSNSISCNEKNSSGLPGNCSHRDSDMLSSWTPLLRALLVQSNPFLS